jgi:hypothetical protein
MSRALFWLGAAVLVLIGALGTAIVVMLAASGALRTAPPAWTTELHVLGYPVSVNVAGLARLATAPGVARLLDGRTLATPAGTLVITLENSQLMVRCAPCTLRHSELAPRAVTIARVEVTVARSGDQLAGALRMDSVEIPFSARLESEHIDLHWTLPSTPIASIYRVFAAAIPEASQARIEGTLQAEGRLHLPERKTSLIFSLHNFSVDGLGTEALQSGWFRLGCPTADGRPRTVITGDGEPTWAASDELGNFLGPAVIAAEDQRFHEHAGIDESEIANLLGALDGAPRRGASTITQQLARTLYTGAERSAMRKLREVLYATEMERTLSKARILELYLNTVDWGPGLCGARSAARAYFNKTPAKLSPIEAAWLAGILRNPHAAHADQFTHRAADRTRAEWVLLQMRDWPRRDRVRWSREPLAFVAPKRKSAERQAAPLPTLALGRHSIP